MHKYLEGKPLSLERTQDILKTSTPFSSSGDLLPPKILSKALPNLRILNTTSICIRGLPNHLSNINILSAKSNLGQYGKIKNIYQINESHHDNPIFKVEFGSSFETALAIMALSLGKSSNVNVIGSYSYSTLCHSITNKSICRNSKCFLIHKHQKRCFYYIDKTEDPLEFQMRVVSYFLQSNPSKLNKIMKSTIYQSSTNYSLFPSVKDILIKAQIPKIMKKIKRYNDYILKVDQVHSKSLVINEFEEINSEIKKFGGRRIEEWPTLKPLNNQDSINIANIKQKKIKIRPSEVMEESQMFNTSLGYFNLIKNEKCYETKEFDNFRLFKANLSKQHLYSYYKSQLSTEQIAKKNKIEEKEEELNQKIDKDDRDDFDQLPSLDKKKSLIEELGRVQSSSNVSMVSKTSYSHKRSNDLLDSLTPTSLNTSKPYSSASKKDDLSFKSKLNNSSSCSESDPSLTSHELKDKISQRLNILNYDDSLTIPLQAGNEIGDTKETLFEEDENATLFLSKALKKKKKQELKKLKKKKIEDSRNENESNQKRKQTLDSSNSKVTDIEVSLNELKADEKPLFQFNSISTSDKDTEKCSQNDKNMRINQPKKISSQLLKYLEMPIQQADDLDLWQKAQYSQIAEEMTKRLKKRERQKIRKEIEKEVSRRKEENDKLLQEAIEEEKIKIIMKNKIQSTQRLNNDSFELGISGFEEESKSDNETTLSSSLNEESNEGPNGQLNLVPVGFCYTKAIKKVIASEYELDKYNDFKKLSEELHSSASRGTGNYTSIMNMLRGGRFEGSPIYFESNNEVTKFIIPVENSTLMPNEKEYPFQ